MLLTPDTSSLATRNRQDAVFVLVLTMTGLLAGTTFFLPFAAAVLAAGLPLSVALHRMMRLHQAPGVAPRDPLAGINIAAIHVGGDEGGLIFVLGSIAILALGLPVLRWFLIASVAVAAAVATLRIAWKRSRAGWSR